MNETLIRFLGKKKILAIDTGIEFGWAHFNEQAPDCVGVFRPKGARNREPIPWQERVEESCRAVQGLLDSHPTDFVALEWPRYFESAGGEMVAKKGDLVKLAYCAGAYGRVATERRTGLLLVPVNDWKGQLPKPVAEARILKTLGNLIPPWKVHELQIRSHAWDAVGIGLYLRGLFK